MLDINSIAYDVLCQKQGTKVLVESLGLEIYEAPVAKFTGEDKGLVLILRDAETQQASLMHCSAGSANFDCCTFENHQCLLNALLSSIQYFTFTLAHGRLFDGGSPDLVTFYIPRPRIVSSVEQAIKPIKNPYLGCKSLDEALIEKDLLGVGARQTFD